MEHQIELSHEGTGCAGRPSIEVPVEQVVALKNTGFSWSKICRLFGISRSTLYRFRLSNDMDGLLTRKIPTDEELTEKIISIKSEFPKAGYRYVWAYLKKDRWFVPWLRLVSSMKVIDAEGIAQRKKQRLKRRQYKVKAANFMWHMDGNEKLVNYNMYIHGCIDGYSRKIIYLELALMKTADVVLNFFQKSVTENGLPMRVRADGGTENNYVEYYMESTRDDVASPFIRGRSVHNVRIERLWGETNWNIASTYKSIFQELEESDDLDPLEYLDLLCLTYVYFPRISDVLQTFKHLWNDHGLKTEKFCSPNQLWLVSLLELSYQRNVHEERLVPDNFNSNVSSAHETIQNRNYRISESAFGLNPQLINYFNEIASFLVPDPTANDLQNGKFFYKSLRNYFKTSFLIGRRI